MSQLKKLVNDKPLWDAFEAELEERIQSSYKTFSQTDDPIVMQRMQGAVHALTCLLYTSPSPRDRTRSRMPSSA